MVYTRPPGKFQRAYKRKQYGLLILKFELCTSHRSLLFFKVSRKEPSDRFEVFSLRWVIQTGHTEKLRRAAHPTRPLPAEMRPRGHEGQTFRFLLLARKAFSTEAHDCFIR